MISVVRRVQMGMCPSYVQNVFSNPCWTDANVDIISSHTNVWPAKNTIPFWHMAAIFSELVRKPYNCYRLSNLFIMNCKKLWIYMDSVKRILSCDLTRSRTHHFFILFMYQPQEITFVLLSHGNIDLIHTFFYMYCVIAVIPVTIYN